MENKEMNGDLSLCTPMSKERQIFCSKDQWFDSCPTVLITSIFNDMLKKNLLLMQNEDILFDYNVKR